MFAQMRLIKERLRTFAKYGKHRKVHRETASEARLRDNARFRWLCYAL